VKYLHLVWAGVWRRPGRATLTLLSIVNAFLLYGLLQGFVSGIGSTVEDTHADVLITASRISQYSAYSAPKPMSASTRTTANDQIARPRSGDADSLQSA